MLNFSDFEHFVDAPNYILNKTSTFNSELANTSMSSERVSNKIKVAPNYIFYLSRPKKKKKVLEPSKISKIQAITLVLYTRMKRKKAQV